MIKYFVTLASAVFLLAACESGPTDDGAAGASGDAGSRYGSGNIGADGTGYLDRNVGDRVFYGYDSSVLTSEGQRTLEAQASWLQQHPNLSVTIEGHCDERGTREYNLALGERRAASAKNYLVSLGVNPGRITTVSFGKERPAVLGSNEAAWAQNRRAVTTVK